MIDNTLHRPLKFIMVRKICNSEKKRSLQRRLLTTTAVVTLTLVHPECIYSWQKWEYSSYSTDDWRELWSLANGPGERRGHTMVLFNESNIILFGGRGNEAHRPHVPTRYNIVDEGGVLEFSTYDGMPLSSKYNPHSPRCQPVARCVPLTNATSGNEEVCAYSWEHLLGDNPSESEQMKLEEECGFVPVGVYYNDVWIYDTDCLRYADLACADDGWRILHPGMSFGGCTYEDGEYSCETPSERYGHGAAMLDETTMAIYGGYSHECEDYCDDFWLFDLVSFRWRKDETLNNPGALWEFSLVSNSERELYLFGGHRLWHGFSTDNSAENRWKSRELLPEGGYFDDLWKYDPAVEGDAEKWVKVERKPICVDAPGLTWESRNDKRCEVRWPSPRSGHAAIYDGKRNGMWVSGGYSTYFPYPTSTDAGSSWGAQGMGRNHIALYPTHSFYLDDLWFYDMETGFWEKKRTFGRKPHQRTDHILALSDDILILHGGYADNYHFNDTWYYIIDENRWLEKEAFVHAYYPDTCTDDFEEIDNNPECIELDFPPDLRRSNVSTFALKYQEILPYSEQAGYTPDPDHPFYFGIVDDAEQLIQGLRRKYLEKEVYDSKGSRIWIESTVPDGTPIAPNAASAPRQFAQRKMMKYNETTDLEIWEWCVSVKGEPTRRALKDGKDGRTTNSVFIPQPRRQSPGWDGCEDTKWKFPPSRSDHASIYIPKHEMLVTHGGVGYDKKHPHPSYPVTDYSPPTRVLDDLWVLNLHNCAHNCSNNGVCNNGFCKCDPGFWGMDCSNYTCPGSVCHYDDNHVQHCTHCCFDQVGDRKIPCRLDDGDEEIFFTGRSEGVCDGFGTCQCAPPYIGEDCSILDCKHNCSFNGYCSVEFPQSRCMCKDGYTGEK
ncbi:hypothetical protein ACHAXS_005490 [Conticribra weissflogii]